MDCHDVSKFIHAYLDDEFEEEERVALATHLARCGRCRALVRFEERFAQRVRSCAPRVCASEKLRASVAHRMARERLAPTRGWVWGAAPVTAAVIAMVGVFIWQRSDLRAVAQESVQWHRTRLPMDVRGAQRERIQRFFSDKVPFAVRLPRFPANAQLIGARLSNLRERRAVYLVYRVGGERVSVFLVDPHALPDGGRPLEAGGRQVNWQDVSGYNVMTYVSSGTGYAVTSEMDRRRLVRLISAR